MISFDVLVVERGHSFPGNRRTPSRGNVPRGPVQDRGTVVRRQNGEPFQPGVYYWVGGNTKFYGGSLPRFRVTDFEETQHYDGISPKWPFSYADLEPFYAEAERLYQVHGIDGEDPTEPPRSSPTRCHRCRTSRRSSDSRPPSASRDCTRSTHRTA